MKKVLITILVLIEIFSLHLLYKSYNNKNVLEDNKEEIVENNNTVAIKVENDSGGYVYATSFPGDDYYVNESMTECVDQAGNKVDGVSFSVSGTSVTVNSKYTAYCTLYFGKCGGGNTALKGKSGVSNCPVGGMFRYQGTAVNNYICFGTNNKTTCTNSPETYMYRIIGVTPDNHLKIMKENDIGAIYWTDKDSSYVGKDKFYGVNLYNQLNGAKFLSNDTYVPNGWGDKIFAYNYYNGYSNNFLSVDAETIYKIEDVVGDGNGHPILGSGPAWEANTFKIALPYVHDYLYSIAGNTSNCSSSGNCYSWMAGYSKNYPTMSACGYGATAGSAPPCGIYFISNTAYINVTGSSPQNLTNVFNIKPSFYLNSNITLSSATGSSLDPYLIN